MDNDTLKVAFYKIFLCVSFLPQAHGSTIASRCPYFEADENTLTFLF